MRKNDIKLIKQHDERDCGAACLAMIATNYGYCMPFQKYRELVNTDRIGTTLEGLVEGSKKIGFKSDALKGNTSELLEAYKNKEIILPIIIHMKNNHFCVLYKIYKKMFYIADPEGKKIILTVT